MNNDEFLALLRSEVVAADARHQAPNTLPATRRNPRGRWLGAAAVLLLIAGVVVALRPAPAAAGVEVIADADGLTIRLTDLTTRPEEVEQAARDAGLDVTVTAEPVGPSRVGRFTGLTASGGTSTIQITEGDAETGFTALRLPRDFEDSLELQIGRAPRPGEEWAQPSDATAAGEPLECADLLGESLAAALEAADRADVKRVRVNFMDEGRWLDEDELSDYLRATVKWASNVSEDEVHIYIASDSRPTAASSDSLDDGC